jgi:hydrogenase nickel incorporation protein HypB
MFAVADAVILNKADLLQVFEFDVEYFQRGIEMVNPDVPLFPISCRTGAGLDAWLNWLLEKQKSFAEDRKQSVMA